MYGINLTVHNFTGHINTTWRQPFTGALRCKSCDCMCTDCHPLPRVSPFKVKKLYIVTLSVRWLGQYRRSSATVFSAPTAGWTVFLFQSKQQREYNYTVQVYDFCASVEKSEASAAYQKSCVFVVTPRHPCSYLVLQDLQRLTYPLEPS